MIYEITCEQMDGRRLGIYEPTGSVSARIYTSFDSLDLSNEKAQRLSLQSEKGLTLTEVFQRPLPFKPARAETPSSSKTEGEWTAARQTVH